MAHPSQSTRLLVNTTSEDSSSPLQQKSVCISCPPSKYLCLPSKAAILILLWTVIVGTMYYIFMGLAAVIQITNSQISISFSVYDPLPYAIFTIIMMFYPLSGFIADVCCGRLKTVVVSLVILLFSLIILLIAIILVEKTNSNLIHPLSNNKGILIVVLGFLLLISFIIGLAGYHSNFIQLGLDQLFEAPSRYLGLFIHYAIWAFQSGSLILAAIIATYFSLRECSRGGVLKIVVALSSIVLYVSSTAVLLLIGYWKRQWFHFEPGHQNPYKTVYDIMKFSKSHKYPLQRSAFTHCDNKIPSRLDFAKERFGGPFTTEQVENVKTFFRMLVILFATGPVFALEVPASYFIFPSFGMHLVYPYHHREFCHNKFVWKVITGSGIMMTLVSTVILFPGYIWIIFFCLRRKVPKLFIRLRVGIALCILGVVSLLITDVVGHALYKTTANHSLCVFQATLSHNKSLVYPSLHMHWGVLILPSILLGIGPLLVIATTLEFISAQSPQSMKGLLVGVFFAIRGLFQFLNSIIIIPLSLKKLWASKEMIERRPVTNCGFVYLLLTSVTGLIGLILFTLAAKRYKYRTRDEGMFHQHEVEEVYDRYMDQAASDSNDYSFDSSSD